MFDGDWDFLTTLELWNSLSIAEPRALVQIAARGAFREAMPKAGVRLLEPVMKVSRRNKPNPEGRQFCFGQP